MAADGNIIPLKTSREVAKLASLRPADVIDHPQANAHGFRPVEPIPLIDQDGHRVLIRGRLYRTLMTLSNATRVAEALQTLAELGCELPEPPLPPQAA